MTYLETHHIKSIKNFCQINCQTIISEKNKNDLEFFRGKYKGLTYGIRTMNYLLSQKNTHTKKNDLYHHFKQQQQVVHGIKYKDGNFDRGVKDSLYKIMNMISGLQ